MNPTRTHKNPIRIIHCVAFSLALISGASVLGGQATQQCTTLVSGLRNPLGTALTNQGNLLVSETGTTAPHSGRISIVAPNGTRRTLLRGLPTGLSEVGDPSGPHGIVMRGRTLYVAIGSGDVGIGGPFPGATLVNPNGPSSPLFSSVLAIHFSAATENTTSGFALTFANQQALANGCESVTLSDSSNNTIVIRLVVDFPNFIRAPLPTLPDNIQLSNPFGLALADDSLYVTDGGRNLTWEVDLGTRSFNPLVKFPNIPNPLFPTLGGPFIQAVPTGIASFHNQLFVALFRGFPFLTGVSSVNQVDPATGSNRRFITGLTTAIDILPLQDKGKTSYLVLQFSSAGPFFQGPGLVLRFDDPAGPATVVADCLSHPTSMTLDKKTGTLYVSENGGRIVAIPFAD